MHGLANTRYDDLPVQQYHDAAQRLAADLKLSSMEELGILSDAIIDSHASSSSTAPKIPKILLGGSAVKHKPSSSIRLLSRISGHSQDLTDTYRHPAQYNSNSSSSQDPIAFADLEQHRSTTTTTTEGSATAEIMDDEKIIGGDHQHQLADTKKCDDVHLFLVRRLHSKDMAIAEKLLSHGFRFAEPVFIAKIMGSKLRIPAECFSISMICNGWLSHLIPCRCLSWLKRSTARRSGYKNINNSSLSNLLKCLHRIMMYHLPMLSFAEESMLDYSRLSKMTAHTHMTLPSLSIGTGDTSFRLCRYVSKMAPTASSSVAKKDLVSTVFMTTHCSIFQHW